LNQIREMGDTRELESEFNRFTELRRRLIEADPEIDETTLLDTLEGATNLHEALGEVIRSALDDEALADSLKLRLEAMRARLERIETASAKKREVALAVMEEAGIEKILEPDFTISMRVQPPGLVVTNEADIPEWYWIPQPAKLDRRKVLETLKAGTAVMGTELANSRVSLVVRTK
jgi:Siphovirus Gp157